VLGEVVREADIGDQAVAKGNQRAAVGKIDRDSVCLRQGNRHGFPALVFEGKHRFVYRHRGLRFLSRSRSLTAVAGGGRFNTEALGGRPLKSPE
jgi:hypothetical protein